MDWLALRILSWTVAANYMVWKDVSQSLGLMAKKFPVLRAVLQTGLVLASQCFSLTCLWGQHPRELMGLGLRCLPLIIHKDINNSS